MFGSMDHPGFFYTSRFILNKVKSLETQVRVHIFKLDYWKQMDWLVKQGYKIYNVNYSLTDPWVKTSLQQLSSHLAQHFAQHLVQHLAQITATNMYSCTVHFQSASGLLDYCTFSCTWLYIVI